MGRQAGGGDAATRDGEGGVARGSHRPGRGVGDEQATDGAVDRDIIGTIGGIDADDVGGDGRIQVGNGSEGGELDDTVRCVVGAELAVTDKELRLEARSEIVELDLIRRTQGGRPADVQRAAGVGVENIIHPRQGQRARARAGKGDSGVTVGAQRTGGLGGVQRIRDIVEGAAFERERGGVAEAGREVVDRVIDGERGTSLDDQAVADGSAEGIKGASRTGERTGAALE